MGRNESPPAPRRRPRSRSRERDRERSRSRDRIRRERERDRGKTARDRGERPEKPREKDRERERDRERTKRDTNRKRRSLSREKKRRSRSRSRSRSGGPEKSSGNQALVTEADLEGKTDEEAEMMKMMGFAGFTTTKGQHVQGNEEPLHGTVQLVLKRKYRQYMNRKGGFNRPLDAIA